jgi:hypothetical protein
VSRLILVSFKYRFLYNLITLSYNRTSRRPWHTLCRQPLVGGTHQCEKVSTCSGRGKACFKLILELPPSRKSQLEFGEFAFLTLARTLRREQRLSSHWFRLIRQIVNGRWPYVEPMSRFEVTGETLRDSLSTSAMPCAPPRGRTAQGSSYPPADGGSGVQVHELRYTRGGDDVCNGVAKATSSVTSNAYSGIISAITRN